MSGRISFVIDVEDKATLGAVGQTLLFMAGISAAGVIAACKCSASEASTAEFTTGLSELQPGEPVPPSQETVEEALAAFNEQAQRTAPVDTAALFAQVPGGVVTEAPVVPPAPPAPQPAAPTPPAATSLVLDKAGLPWDARINTGNKAQTAKGVWKMTKGLAPGVYDTVVAELKQVMALSQPAAPAVPPTPPTPAAPPVTTPGVGAAPITTAPPAPSATPAVPPTPTPAGAPAVPPVPPAPLAAPVTPPAPAPVVSAAGAEDAPTTYAQLLQHITKHMSAQKITSDEINLVCAQNGLPSLNMAANAQHLVPAIYAGCALIWNSRP